MRGPNQIRQEATAYTSTVANKAQTAASSFASRQLRRVPWRRFHPAYDQYVLWEAFVLWVKAVVTAEGCVPLPVLSAVMKRCPGFVEEPARSQRPELFALHLHEWIHNRIFIGAKQEGWLDALHFYGVRDPRCEGAWAHWEQCEREWQKNPTGGYPEFETWWRAAQERRLFQEVNASRVVDVVETYVDWMAFAHWLRPIIGDNAKPASQVAREMRRRCPDFVIASLGDRPDSLVWQSLIAHIEERFFPQVKSEGWLDYVQQKVGHHPRHIRTTAYSEHWMENYSRNPVVPYPRFSRWRYAADNLVLEDQAG